jgi:hypothetical protein
MRFKKTFAALFLGLLTWFIISPLYSQVQDAIQSDQQILVNLPAMNCKYWGVLTTIFQPSEAIRRMSYRFTLKHIALVFKQYKNTQYSQLNV